MSDSWKEVTEGGQTFWINEEFGNVLKLNDTAFIALIPKVIKVGPFTSLEKAKQAVEDVVDLNTKLEEINQELLKK